MRAPLDMPLHNPPTPPHLACAPAQPSRARHPLRGIARHLVLVAASAGAGLLQAQPSGGMGGGMGGGGHGNRPPENCSPAATAKGPQRPEDLAPPDPMAVLQTRLATARATLALDAAQQALFTTATGDLKDLVHLNERRFWRVMGSGQASVSAAQGLAHRLKAESEDEQDRVATMADFGRSWTALREGLGATQRSLLDTLASESLAPPKPPAKARS